MGIKSQSYGKLFEEVFLKRCRGSGVTITRLPDSCRQLKNKIIRVKSPWDFVLTHNSKTALIDTKTVQGETFVYSDINLDQAKELYSHQVSGAISGYVIWLRGKKRVIFVPASALIYALETGRGSFDETDPAVIDLGEETFEIRHIFLDKRLN